MNGRGRLVLVMAIALLCAGSLAAQVAVAVSPGSETGTVIGDACPTFSWGAAPGQSYELVVYLLSEEGEEAELVITETLPGVASGWTPPLDRCLERGGRYAWSIRGINEDRTSEWSPPKYFEVVSGPTEVEFERALATVQEYLQDHGDAGLTAAQDKSAEAPLAEELVSAPLTVLTTPAAPTATGAGAAPQLVVDGNVTATSFKGDGAELTGVRPDGPCFNSTHRFVDCGNGTVTDTLAGLIYLKDANCWSQQVWLIANLVASGLHDGQCGLTDGSRAGDWRLQTRAEFEALLAPGCTLTPKIRGNGTPAAGCYSANGWASGIVASHYWTSETSDNAETDLAWHVNLFNGTSVYISSKTTPFYVWPVRSFN